MSYYPPHQGGGYGYPAYPPQQYAAGTPVGYPPAGPPVGAPPAPGGYPAYPPQQPPPGPYGYPPPSSGYPPPAASPAPGYGYAPPAPPPGGAGYGYPGGPAAVAPMMATPQPAPTMASIQHAPTMVSIHHAPSMAPPPPGPSYYQQTVVAGSGGMGHVPTPQQDAETLHRACRGFGTDEKKVISVVANRTPEHLQMVVSVYKQFYGRDLVEVLNSETSGNFSRVLHYLILSPLALDAELVYEACSGAGTDEMCLIQVLVGRSNQDMAHLKSMFYSRYHKSMESVVKSDVSGYFEKLLVVSMQGTRDEIGHYQYNVEADVQSLYKAGEGRMGTDESQFIHILTNRPDAHLRLVFQAYQSRYKKKFTKVIKKEFSGWIETGLCYLVNWITNPSHCIAKYLEKSMKGMGTKDVALTRLLVKHRGQPFMGSIKTSYAQKYRRTLRDRVKGETSGDYRRALLSTIGEPEHSA